MFVTLRTACRTAAEWLRRNTRVSESPFGAHPHADVAGILDARQSCSSST